MLRQPAVSTPGPSSPTRAVTPAPSASRVHPRPLLPNQGRHSCSVSQPCPPPAHPPQPGPSLLLRQPAVSTPGPSSPTRTVTPAPSASRVHPRPILPNQDRHSCSVSQPCPPPAHPPQPLRHSCSVSQPCPPPAHPPQPLRHSCSVSQPCPPPAHPPQPLRHSCSCAGVGAETGLDL